MLRLLLREGSRRSLVCGDGVETHLATEVRLSVGRIENHQSDCFLLDGEVQPLIPQTEMQLAFTGHCLTMWARPT